MAIRFAGQLPWALTFSFGQAIQQPALALWHGQDENGKAAQQALFDRAETNCAARRGQAASSIMPPL